MDDTDNYDSCIGDKYVLYWNARKSKNKYNGSILVCRSNYTHKKKIPRKIYLILYFLRVLISFVVVLLFAIMFLRHLRGYAVILIGFPC